MEDGDNEGVSLDRIKGPASEIRCHLLVPGPFQLTFQLQFSSSKQMINECCRSRNFTHCPFNEEKINRDTSVFLTAVTWRNTRKHEHYLPDLSCWTRSMSPIRLMCAETPHRLVPERRLLRLLLLLLRWEEETGRSCGGAVHGRSPTPRGSDRHRGSSSL